MGVEVVMVVEMERTQRTEDRGRFRHGDDLSGAGTSMAGLTFTPNREGARWGGRGGIRARDAGAKDCKRHASFIDAVRAPYTHTPP
jgi:hypothetical protein